MGKAGTTLPRARGICLVLTHLRRYSAFPQTGVFGWLRGVDLNHRPLGYEPNELPDCSTPRLYHSNGTAQRQFSWALLRGFETSTFSRSNRLMSLRTLNEIFFLVVERDDRVVVMHRRAIQWVSISSAEFY